MIENKEFISKLFIECTYVLNRQAVPEWRISMERCNFENLVFVYGGKGYFTKNGERITVGRGDLVFFEGGCMRSMRTDKEDPIKFHTVNFAYVMPEFNGEYWTLKHPKLEFDFVKKVNDEILFERLLKLFGNLSNVRISSGNMRRSKEREIIAKILEATMFLYETGANNYSNKLRAEKAIKYIHENYNKKITLAELAKTAGLSVSYFNTAFKSVTSMTPIDFVIFVRISKAKEFLSSGAGVAETAEKCGFSDVFYFSRMFKKSEKMTPGEYARNATTAL